MVDRAHGLHVMQHSTTQPEQVQTDHMLVFRDETDFHGNLELIKQVEVPRYSQPTEDGVRLDHDKRLALSVARAVESGGSFVSSLDDPFVELGPDQLDQIEGEAFAVMRDMSDRTFEWVEYEQNPAFDAVFDPENSEDLEDRRSSSFDAVWDPEVEA